MRKLLCLAFLFLSALTFAQTATVTGHTVTGSGTTSSSGISVLWDLINDNGQQCSVGGVGLITPMSLTFTPAQLAAGVTMYKNSSITCGTTTGGTRWRYTLKANGTGTRSCTLNITGNTNLDTATCLNATATPTTTVPTASLFWLLDGSNFPTGNFIPLVNGTQAIGSSAFRWNMFANTADITNLTVGSCTGCGGGGSTPTGTGFPHITGGVQDPAARLLLSGDIPSNAANTSGNAATATALDHNPADCSAGSYATGIDATGLATGCTVAGTGTVTHTGGALTLNQLLFGNGTGDIAVGNLTGDVTTSGGKATTLATVATPATNTKITYNAKGLVTSGTAAACADLSDDAPSCNTDTTNAVNITSGTIPAARMPAYTGDVTSPVNSTVNTLATIIPNAHAFSGAITYCTLQGMPVAGSSCFATIQAAENALPSTGGTVLVPANYSETLAANLTLNKSASVLRFLGNATITLGAFQVIVPSGTHGVSIISDVIHSSTPAVNAGVSFQGYTGAACSICVGDSTGFTHNFLLRGIAVNLDTGALANAQGILLTNVDYSAIEYPWITIGAVSGQQGIATLGTGAFFTGIINMAGVECNASSSATNDTCIFGGAISNGINIIGGHINMGGVLNGSVGIDVNGTASGGWYVAGFDCDVSNTCVKVESTAIAAISGFVRQDSSSTSTANFGAGSQGNNLVTNAVLPVTDTGIAGTNSVVTPNALVHNTRAWTMTQSTGSLIWNDKVDATSRLLFAQGAGQSTRINGGSGAGQVIFNQDSGTGGALAAWSLNKLGQTDIVSSSGAINTGETIIVKTPALVANRLVAGTHFRITLAGTCTSSAANVSTFTLRWGTLGTTSDGTVAAIATSVAATTGTNAGFRAVIDLVVRVAGASATSTSFLQLTSDGNIGIVATPNAKSVAGTAFNTTTASGILSLAYKSAATTTTSTFTIASIEIVDN